MQTLSVFKEHFSTLPGYFSEVSLVIWDSLLSHQQRCGVRGSLLEIGVFKGKSAGALALFTRENEDLALIDLSDDLEEVASNLDSFCSGTVKAIQARSDAVEVSDWGKSEEPDYRWIHIDGEHTAKAVLSDLELAEQLLSDKGIICVDDFFSYQYPQITLATADFLSANAGRLTLFLTGWNKAYLCRPEYAAANLLPYVRDSLVGDLENRGYKKFTLYKTDYPDHYNCFGLGMIYPGRRLHGPDSDPDTIPI
jgi:hypothetical protein